jgi:hypothetical protein
MINNPASPAATRIEEGTWKPSDRAPMKIALALGASGPVS